MVGTAALFVLLYNTVMSFGNIKNVKKKNARYGNVSLYGNSPIDIFPFYDIMKSRGGVTGPCEFCKERS